MKQKTFSLVFVICFYNPNIAVDNEPFLTLNQHILFCYVLKRVALICMKRRYGKYYKCINPCLPWNSWRCYMLEFISQLYCCSGLIVVYVC